MPVRFTYEQKPKGDVFIAMKWLKGIGFPVALVTLFAFFYQATPYFGFSDTAIMLMFCISPFLFIWMVYRVLRDGKPSEKTWDEHFYEDLDYRRSGSSD